MAETKKEVINVDVTTAKTGKLDKIKEFGKKHYKKLLGGALMIGAGIIGFGLGKSRCEAAAYFDTDEEDFDDFNESEN